MDRVARPPRLSHVDVLPVMPHQALQRRPLASLGAAERRPPPFYRSRMSPSPKGDEGGRSRLHILAVKEKGHRPGVDEFHVHMGLEDSRSDVHSPARRAVNKVLI